MSEQHNHSDMVSPDDKIMAALGHATIIWPAMGIIAPLIIWATQREKSRFVAFQALQAVAYHMTLIIAGFACGVCYVCCYVGMIVPAMLMPFSAAFTAPEVGGELPPEAMIPFLPAVLAMMAAYVTIFGLLFLGLAVWAAYIGYGLYGAFANLRGKNFRYVILGSRLERYLEGTAAKPATPS